MMELFITLIIPFIILGILWDSQPVFIRILEEKEQSNSFCYTVSKLKWPVLFKQKVYWSKQKNQWVIPTTPYMLEPVLSLQELEEAYMIWQYENSKS